MAKQSALVVHAVLSHFGEAPALCTYARNQQEVVGSVFADIQEHFSLGSAYHIHHLFVRSPILRLFQYLFEQPFAVGIFRQLEIVRAFVGGQCQQDHPGFRIDQERFHAVFAHIRGDCYGVDLDMVEERTCIHFGSVSDVPALCICNDKLVGIVFTQVSDSLFERQHPFYA